MASLIKITLIISLIAQSPKQLTALEKIKACQAEFPTVKKANCEQISNLIEKLVKTRENFGSWDLSNLNLSQIDLTDSNLQNANFQNTHLDNVDFTNANLAKTQFSGILWGNNFTNANLRRAVIKGTITSNFTSADLSDAVLTRARVAEGTFKSANFTRANLNSAKFESTNLDRASFVNANLSSVQFTPHYGSDPGTSLIGVNFTNANLQKAIFGAYTNLEDSNFQGANLTNATFIKTENLTPTQVKSACNWEQAIYNFASERNPFPLQITKADRLASQKYINNLKQDRASDPRNPIDCDRWK